MPDVPDLIVFAAIADHGSLTAAARHLNVQKSSVSRTLGLLEDRYGHRLIERTTRQLRLTEAGALLLDHAHRVAEEIETAEAAMARLSAEPAGNLHVTAPHAVVQHIIIPMLPGFLARYPNIKIGIDASSHNVDLVSEGIDLAVRMGPLASSSLIARKLGSVSIVLAASPGYIAKNGMPRDIADLAAHSLVSTGAQITRSRWGFGKDLGEITMTPSLVVNETGLLRDMAVAGLGIIQLAEVQLFADFEAGRLVRVLPHIKYAAPSLYAVYPSRRALAPKVTVFIDALATEFERIS